MEGGSGVFAAISLPAAIAEAIERNAPAKMSGICGNELSYLQRSDGCFLFSPRYTLRLSEYLHRKGGFDVVGNQEFGTGTAVGGTSVPEVPSLIHRFETKGYYAAISCRIAPGRTPNGKLNDGSAWAYAPRLHSQGGFPH
jgi:hypothetical protein